MVDSAKCEFKFATEFPVTTTRADNGKVNGGVKTDTPFDWIIDVVVALVGCLSEFFRRFGVGASEVEEVEEPNEGRTGTGMARVDDDEEEDDEEDDTFVEYGEEDGWVDTIWPLCE